MTKPKSTALNPEGSLNFYEQSSSSVLYVKKAATLGSFKNSDITIEKFFDILFYYQDLIVEWVKRFFPRPSPIIVACGATLYFVAVCITIQRQQGDRWFSTFLDTKLPALSEPSQKVLWDTFENVTSQYMTLGQSQEVQSLCDSSVISRVDLSKRRVFIRLKSPWEKQSRQQYAGLFYENDNNKDKDVENIVSTQKGIEESDEIYKDVENIVSTQKGIEESDEIYSDEDSLASTFENQDLYFDEKSSLGIKPWYQIEARHDDNPPFFRASEANIGEDKLCLPFFSSKVSGFVNPLKKTKNLFPVEHKITLWHYFSFRTNKERVYLENDNIPTKLDSAVLSSFLQKYKDEVYNKIEKLDSAVISSFLQKFKDEVYNKMEIDEYLHAPHLIVSDFNFTPGQVNNPRGNSFILSAETKISSHTAKIGENKVLVSNLVACKLSKSQEHKRSLTSKDSLLEKTELYSSLLDSPHLKVWFDKTRGFENGEDFSQFQDQLKSLFYSQGIIPLPELNELDDEFFEEPEQQVELIQQDKKIAKTEGLASDDGNFSCDQEGKQSVASTLKGEEEENDKAVNEISSGNNQELSQYGDDLHFSNKSTALFKKTLSSHFYFDKNMWISPRFMSGYRFPELSKKELSNLHEQFIRRRLLPFPFLSMYSVFSSQKLASQLSLIPLEIYLPPYLPASIFRDMFSPSFFSPFYDKQGLFSPLFKTRDKTLPLNWNWSKVPEVNMTYRLIHLEEEKEVEKAFARLGRDYKDYLSYPKDGLEALKISPSLEDEEKNEEILAEAREMAEKVELGKVLQKFAYKKGYAVKKENETSDLPDTRHLDLNPWISSLWGPENMLSDRKSSFLGIQNVLRKGLISRERQEIASEILTPTNVRSEARLDFVCPLPNLKARGRRNEIFIIRPAKFEPKNDIGWQHRTVKTKSLLRKKPVIATHLAIPFETHHIMPKISKAEWRQIIEYQLRQYFIEEDKRLEPLLKKNPDHHFKLQRVNIFLPWVRIRTPKEKSIEWPLTRLDYAKIDFLEHNLLVHNDVPLNLTPKFQAPPENFIDNFISKHRITLSSGKAARLGQWINYVVEKLNSLNLIRQGDEKVLSHQVTFEPFTKYSWLIIYRLFLVFALRDIAKYLYRVTLKDFMIGMAHTHFGLAVTSKEFRKWLQFAPPKLFYKPHKRLQDLAGLNEIIPSLSEIIWFLKNSGRGGGVPRGVLLVGPPGTGKTFLVQAIAGEAQVPVVVQSMSSLSRVDPEERPYDRLHEMFQIARKQAPCILFMDEIDAIAESRGGVIINDIGAADSLFSLEGDLAGRASYSLQTQLFPKKDRDFISTHLKDVSIHQEKKETEARRVNLLLRLLTEMDGLRPLNAVVLLATTNRPAVLDPALLRPGRFEKMIHLQLPGHKKRIDLFKLYTKKIGSVEKMPWDYLATRTADMSGADIAAAINHSAIRAILDDTSHTVETLEQGLNYITGIPLSFPLRAQFARTQFINSKAFPYHPQRGGKGDGAPTVGLGIKQGLSLQHRKYSDASERGEKDDVNQGTYENIAYPVYAVHGRFAQDKYHLNPDTQAIVLNKRNIADCMKHSFNISRLAYYQAGKGVVHTVLAKHPKVGFLDISLQNDDQSPLIKTRWQKLTSPQGNHRKVDLETTIIGLYAGKAAEMLHLSVNSFKDNSLIWHLSSSFPQDKLAFSKKFISQQPSRGSVQRLHRERNAPAVLKIVLASNSVSNKNSQDHQAWLYQSNLGFPELLIASSLAHLMIDRWYLYSKSMFSLKTNRLISSLNEEQISNDDLFPLFTKLCREINRDRPKRKLTTYFSFEFEEDLTASEQRLLERAQREGKFNILLEGIEQQRIILSWWVEKIYRGIEMSERPYAQWYRLYLPKPEEKERNEEWVAPDFYYNQTVNLSNLSKHKYGYTHVTQLRNKAGNKLHKKGMHHFSFLPQTSTSRVNKTEHDKFLEKLLKNKKLSETEFVPGQSVKTWNDLYWVERDYSYHNLVTTCFYTAFLLLNENRELLDFLADHLMRFQKLRKHEIARICSLFQAKMYGIQHLPAYPKNIEQSSSEEDLNQIRVSGGVNIPPESGVNQHSLLQNPVIFSESSAPLSPSWLEQKAVKKKGFSESSAPQYPSWLEPKTVKKKGFSSKLNSYRVPTPVKKTSGVQDSKPNNVGESKKLNEKKLTEMTTDPLEKQEKIESQLQENQNQESQENQNQESQENQNQESQEALKIVKKPLNSNISKKDDSLTDLKEIQPVLETGDSQSKQKNVEKDAVLIIEKGWGRFARNKKPNFIRFDFIKVFD